MWASLGWFFQAIPAEQGKVFRLQKNRLTRIETLAFVLPSHKDLQYVWWMESCKNWNFKENYRMANLVILKDSLEIGAISRSKKIEDTPRKTRTWMLKLGNSRKYERCHHSKKCSFKTECRSLHPLSSPPPLEKKFYSAGRAENENVTYTSG